MVARFLACWAAVFALSLAAADLNSVRDFYCDQSSQPDPRSLLAFDLSVLSPHAELDMEPGHALGNRYLALLDVASFRTGSREAMLAVGRGTPSKPDAKDDHLRFADLSHSQWIPWVVESFVDPAAKKGFDGFAITLGRVETTPEARVALLTLAATIRQRFPDKTILMDFRSGLDLQAASVADGFFALGVYTRPGRSGGQEWTPIAEVQKVSRRIRTVQMQGLRVFGVDYCPEDDRQAAREAAQRLSALGVTPFITTPALDGVNLGPLEEINRRVIVLHGWDEKHTGQAAPAAESTATARFLTRSLEWLGCQLEFRCASCEDFLPERHDFAALILDPGLLLSSAQQRTLAAWLPSLRVKKIPLLLAGMPFTDEVARQLALEHLGLGGSAKPVSSLAKANVASVDSTLMVPGAHVQARTLGFLDLTAPADARVVLSLRGTDALGGEKRFDQAFLANWGAACIDSAFEIAGPQVHLPAFLAAWLGESVAPVPDTTTREGRRVFYSHIEGAGFSTPSTLPGFPLCAEVMRDRIIDRYLLPVTVSICEADVRGWFPGQQLKEAVQLEHVARSIFEMPQVQAASNSFTRPERWTAGIEVAAKLNERAQTTRLDMEREIAGSMSYIHRRLLPIGKNVSLMLWPSNATPTPEALNFCDAMSVEHLPSLPATAHAEDSKFRLEPKAVRMRFDQVRTEQGIVALEKELDACAAEPLHATTAAAYAASGRDARQTRILRVADRHWIVLNSGDCRTFRLPASAGVPDMARCMGISGFKVQEGQVYIHTIGSGRADVVMTEEAPAPHVHLSESSTAVEFMDLSSRRATFHVRDLRPVEMVFGGFEPHGQCAYLENGRPYTANADAAGFVRLELVCRATVSLQSLPPATKAAMR
ncbi:MAG: hypothetical protein R3F13_21845 [Prosthecobacter sp.]